MPNPKFRHFWAKKYQLSNLSKILTISYFEGAYSKSSIRFREFRNQILKFGYFGPKSINFRILIKLFEIYLNSWMVGISIITLEQKFTIVLIMGRNQSTLGEIVLRCGCQVESFFIIISLKRLNNRITIQAFLELKFVNYNVEFHNVFWSR